MGYWPVKMFRILQFADARCQIFRGRTVSAIKIRVAQPTVKIAWRFHSPLKYEKINLT
jgi:hypothetical protein